MGVTFSIKTRESKDKFIDSNLRNVLSELSADIVNYGTDIVLRKLVITSISLEIAQNLGIDYHAPYGGALLLYAEKGSRYSCKNIGIH